MPGGTTTVPAISANSATHPIVTRRIHRSAAALTVSPQDQLAGDGRHVRNR